MLKLQIKKNLDFFMNGNLYDKTMIILNRMSSLFGAFQEQPSEPIPLHTVKNFSFRQQIRRRHNNERFKAVRVELMHSLKSLEFLEDLKSQRDNVTPKKIKQLVAGLQMGRDNANFYQNIMDMQLDYYLCDMFRNPELQLQQRTKVLHTLVQLTYFCQNSVDAVIQNNIVDNLMTMIKGFQMLDPVQQSFTYFSAQMVLNTTASFNKDLCIYIMESDFMRILQNIVEKSARKEENLEYYRSDLREVMLRVYTNLFMHEACQIDFACKALFRLLNDHRNSLNITLTIQLMACVANAARIPKVWASLQNQLYGTYGLLFKQILDLANTLRQSLIDGKPVIKGIKCFILLLNSLYELDLRQAQAADHILSILDPLFIQSIIEELHKMDTGSSKKTLCKTFKMLSYAFNQTDYKFFLPDKKYLCVFLQILLQKNLITHPTYGKYCVRVLWMLLRQDKTTMDPMIDNGVYDAIRDLLDFQHLQQAKIEIISLVQCMIDIEQSVRPRQSTNNRLIEAFEQRGIIKDIEKLQDNDMRELFKKSEAFMQWISQLPSQASQSN